MANVDRDDQVKRNQKSRELWDKACRLIVGGGQAHKRPVKYLLRGGPAFASRAQGAYFWDADGNKYIDYLLSYGPIVLGHADPEVNEAIRRQIEMGTLYSVEHPLSVEVAESLCRTIPCAEMVLYFIGGSSATQGAIRCARAHTKREKIIRCGYHGWYDWCWPTIPGVPRHEQELILAAPYNDLGALEGLLKSNAGQVAGVIVEAVQNEGPAENYFAGVRRLCDEHGAVFILDEVKTGFRLDLGGAQKRYGIDADLATFGKAMCNGYPAAVVVGKRKIMEARTDTYLAATFHADALSLTAAQVVMRVLRERNGPAHFERLGRRLMDGLNQVFVDLKYPLKITGSPAMPGPVQTGVDDPKNPCPPEFAGKVITEWCASLQRRGVYATGHVWFLSLAHTEADIDQTIAIGADAAKEAMGLLKDIVAGKVDPQPYQ